jgi:hypothetical protein
LQDLVDRILAILSDEQGKMLPPHDTVVCNREVLINIDHVDSL